MNRIILCLLTLLTVASLVCSLGCKRSTYPIARTQESKDAPKYTTEANKDPTSPAAVQ